MWRRCWRVVERCERLKPLAARDQPSEREGLAVCSLHKKPRVGKLVATDTIFGGLDAGGVRIHVLQRLLPHRGLRGNEGVFNLAKLLAIDVCCDLETNFIDRRKANKLTIHTP